MQQNQLQQNIQQIQPNQYLNRNKQQILELFNIQHVEGGILVSEKDALVFMEKSRKRKRLCFLTARMV